MIWASQRNVAEIPLLVGRVQQRDILYLMQVKIGGDNVAFGEMLVKLRKTKGMSQEQLAEAIGLTRQTISKWELNQSTPDINYLVQLSDFFSVSTDYLIKGEDASNILESNPDTKGIENNTNNVNAYKWCFYLGTVSLGVSMLGMLAFMICSAMAGSYVYVDVNNREYDGTVGFLICTDTLWFFILLAVLFIAGGALAAFGIVKSMKARSATE